MQTETHMQHNTANHIRELLGIREISGRDHCVPVQVLSADYQQTGIIRIPLSGRVWDGRNYRKNA